MVHGFAPASGIIDLIAGGVLLAYSWDLSWFTYTPPTSSTPLTVFSPSVTFYPSLILLALGVIVLVLAVAQRRMGTPPTQLMNGFSMGHLIFGGGLLALALTSYSFNVKCADPGGCREYFELFWPLILPGVLLLAIGLSAMVLGIASARKDDASRR